MNTITNRRREDDGNELFRYQCRANNSLSFVSIIVCTPVFCDVHTITNEKGEWRGVEGMEGMRRRFISFLLLLFSLLLLSFSADLPLFFATEEIVIRVSVPLSSLEAKEKIRVFPQVPLSSSDDSQKIQVVSLRETMCIAVRDFL